jgi:O-antigen ligase
LGTSGPAIHHNGTLLPENYYFQILLDIGTVGFLLWAIVFFQIIGMQYHLRQVLKNKKLTEMEQAHYLAFQKLQL